MKTINPNMLKIEGINHWLEVLNILANRARIEDEEVSKRLGISVSLSNRN